MRKLTFLLALIIHVLNVFSQPQNLIFSNITVDDGLPNNQTHCAFQDSRGWMWFGTTTGLCRFDGYKLVTFLPTPDDTSSFKRVLVRSIVEDKDASLWIGTELNGLYKFDRKKETFTRFLAGKSINKLIFDGPDILWIATTTGLLKFDIRKGVVLASFSQADKQNGLRHDFIRALALDNNNQLWIGTYTGIDVLDRKTSKISHLSIALNDEVHELYFDKNGLIWIGTFSNGLFIYNPQTKLSEHIIPDKNYERSFSVRHINCDANGIYWIATRGGLYLLNYQNRKMQFFSHSEHESTSLCNNSVMDIFFDRVGDAWLSTRGGVSYCAAEKQVFRHFKAFPNDNRYLNDNEVFAFWNEPNGNLWIGTENGGINIYNHQTETYSYIKGRENNLTANTIKDFEEDGKGNLWVATFMGGINVVNIASKHVVKHYMNVPGDPNSLADNRVWSMKRDRNNNIWLGTDRGLDCFNASKQRFEHYENITGRHTTWWISEDKEHDLWLSQNLSLIILNPETKAFKKFEVAGRSVFCDSKGRYWLTSNFRGLILFDKQKGPIRYYSENDGLASNRTFCIEEDRSGKLWISTTNGLSQFNPETGEFRNYDKRDGLQNNQFYYGAGLKLASGEMIFGGVNGYNIFDPNKLGDVNNSSNLVFTDFKIFNQKIEPKDENGKILSDAISEASAVHIPYSQNMFSIEFASLNYAQSHKSQYKYKMQGFDKDWIDAGPQRSAIYTNLNPGKYTFNVKVRLRDDRWSNDELSIKVVIVPPFWKTWWFKILVIIFTLAIIYLLVRYLAVQNSVKQELVMERVRARQIHELDLMKMKFFTNISHEIRTPLTLIIGPVEKMLNQKLSDDDQKSHLDIVYRNAQQLLKLVTQLLDFRKLESGNLKLELRKGNIVDFLESQVGAFRQMALDKGVSLKIHAVDKQIFTFFDSDKVEKIINNLISNALKFTNRGGSVSVNVSLIVDDHDDAPIESDNKYIEIVVKDTGVGIAESNVEKVFLRFFQSNNTNSQSGTGIGLALTRELVKLHRGRITVESKPDKGTRFTVLLPFMVTDEEAQSSVSEVAENTEDSVVVAEVRETDEESNKKILLIIDDNADVRFFIRSHFESSFTVIEAPDGKEGVAVAFKNIPDIIISDIMMPGHDGVEVCRRLKKDERTSHVPIILLTALTSKENTLQGLAAGADDYITKPFDVAILHSKIENLLLLRRSLQIKYSGETVLQPRNITLSSPDDRFLKKAIEIIEKNIEDPDFDSDRFAVELGVSRMQLYRKLNALTDMTVREFIRSIRLKRAAQLIVQDKINISEVAYMVGFRELSHFRKCFRQEFGLSASEYAEKFKESN